MSKATRSRAATSAPKCQWCGVREDADPAIADLVVHGWLCRTLHRARTLLDGRLCGVCVERKACVIDVQDGRPVAVCRDCFEPEIVEPLPTISPRERVLRVLGRSYGLDIVEIAQVLGEDSEAGRARISAVLARAAKDGLVKFSGGRMDRIYSLTEKANVARR